MHTSAGTCECISVVSLYTLHNVSAMVGHWGYLTVGLDTVGSEVMETGLELNMWNGNGTQYQ